MNLVVAVIIRDEKVEIFVWLLDALNLRHFINEISQLRQLSRKFRVFGQTALETSKHGVDVAGCQYCLQEDETVLDEDRGYGKCGMERDEKKIEFRRQKWMM